MKILSFSCFVFLLFGCYEQHSELKNVDSIYYDNITILSVDRPPFFSGYLITWVRIVASVPDKKSVELYIPYMSDEQIFPPIGSRCSMTASEKYLEGITVDENVDEDRLLPVPSLMKCDGKTYRYEPV